MNEADKSVENFDARHFQREVDEERSREVLDGQRDEWVNDRIRVLLTDPASLLYNIAWDIVDTLEYITDLAAFNAEMLDIKDAVIRDTAWEHKAMSLFATMYHYAKDVAEKEWEDKCG